MDDFIMRARAFQMHRRHVGNGGLISPPMRAYLEEMGPIYDRLLELERELRS